MPTLDKQLNFRLACGCKWHLSSFSPRLRCLRAMQKCLESRHATTKVYENRTQATCSGLTSDVCCRLRRSSPRYGSLSATAASATAAGGRCRTTGASAASAGDRCETTTASARTASGGGQTAAPSARTTSGHRQAAAASAPTEGGRRPVTAASTAPTSRRSPAAASPRTAGGGRQSTAAIEAAGWSADSCAGAIRPDASCRATSGQRALGECDHYQP